MRQLSRDAVSPSPEGDRSPFLACRTSRSRCLKMKVLHLPLRVAAGGKTALLDEVWR